ncbi:MAG: hypothetical protein Q9214_002815 [Letrouitia sp. 1 TL-2023]
MAHLAVVEDIEPETEDPIVIPQDMVHNKATSVFLSRPCAEFYNASDTGATDIPTVANNTDAQPRSEWHESNDRLLCPKSRSRCQKKPPFGRTSQEQYEHDQARRRQKASSSRGESQTDSMVTTQELPVKEQPQKKDPLLNVKLLEHIASDLHERASVNRADFTRKNETAGIRCQCGYGKEEGVSMIQCFCCFTWQHLHCYGFLNGVPWKTHACYQCLFGVSDRPRFHKLAKLVRMRRALWVLDEEKPESQGALAKALDLGSGESSVSVLVRRMKKEGYLKPVRGSDLIPIQTAAQRQKRLRVYYSPLDLIGHCVRAFESQDSMSTQLLKEC